MINLGTMPDGETVYRADIHHGRLSASIITFGASLQALHLAPHRHSLVLGFPDLDASLENPYFGAMVGRVANRLANGRFILDGQTVETDKNENGIQTLHGGRNGISSRNWKVMAHDGASVTLAITDKPVHAGFPGDCAITCTYSLESDATLKIEAKAITNQDTVCNIVHHSYFNLSSSPSAIGHEIKINADHYLPVDTNLIPTGEVRNVEGTDFDFRKTGLLTGNTARVLDHNFCLNGKASAEEKTPSHACMLRSPETGISMEILTTQPGIQVYAGAGIASTKPGHGGEKYGSFSGIALEPQHWPDAPNHPAFPDITLRRGETRREISLFRFSH